jgi:hypothetical protein
VVPALSFGGSRRPPVLPPSRPSSDALELAERLGLPLPSPVWPPAAEPLAVLGEVERSLLEAPADAEPVPGPVPVPPPRAGG